jgi:hypothetical protein
MERSLPDAPPSDAESVVVRHDQPVSARAAEPEEASPPEKTLTRSGVRGVGGIDERPKQFTHTTYLEVGEHFSGRSLSALPLSPLGKKLYGVRVGSVHGERLPRQQTVECLLIAAIRNAISQPGNSSLIDLGVPTHRRGLAMGIKQSAGPASFDAAKPTRPGPKPGPCRILSSTAGK